MEEQTSKSGKNNIWVYLLAGLVIILVIWIFYQRSQLTKLVNEKEGEKIELQHELDSVIVEHNKIMQEYGALSDSLAAKDSVIQSNAIEIRKLLDTQWEYNKVRKKLAFLRRSPRAMCGRSIRSIP